jgi:itaconyl-CoA hydratase
MQGHDQIGPQRYRESFGRYYDDFKVGDVYEHRPGRTITESDNTWFTLLTMNTIPCISTRSTRRNQSSSSR